MNSTDYKRIYGLLNSRDDIKKIAAEEHLREELLLVILSQKIIRNTKRAYYEVKNKAPALIGKWMQGTRITDIARNENFSPILTASIMLQHTGLSKKQFRNYMNAPEAVVDRRLRSDLQDALKEEIIYSPDGARIQYERGKDVERIVKKWLDMRKVTYITEYDAKKGEYTKTPDFKLEAPIKIQNKWLNWVECKASFGDEVEYRRDYLKQLNHYVSLFGAGMVVYWYGYIEDMPNHLRDDNIVMADRKLFEHD